MSLHENGESKTEFLNQVKEEKMLGNIATDKAQKVYEKALLNHGL